MRVPSACLVFHCFPEVLHNFFLYPVLCPADQGKIQQNSWSDSSPTRKINRVEGPALQILPSDLNMYMLISKLRFICHLHWTDCVEKRVFCFNECMINLLFSCMNFRMHTLGWAVVSMVKIIAKNKQNQHWKIISYDFLFPWVSW